VASGAEHAGRVMPVAQAQPKTPVLRLARPACTYKGAMSDEEIERCR
jgi:hypothetical protein